MNQLAHIFITYFILYFFIPDVEKYLLPVAIFAIILDMDHVPSYIKMLFISKKKRSKMSMNDYVDMFRTAIQEPIGIITIELIILAIYLFGTQSIYLVIAMFGIVIHWLIDFLTVHTRPFDPINKKIICLFFKTKKQRMISEIIITGISAILFVIVYF